MACANLSLSINKKWWDQRGRTSLWQTVRRAPLLNARICQFQRGSKCTGHCIVRASEGEEVEMRQRWRLFRCCRAPGLCCCQQRSSQLMFHWHSRGSICQIVQKLHRVIPIGIISSGLLLKTRENDSMQIINKIQQKKIIIIIIIVMNVNHKNK